MGEIIQFPAKQSQEQVEDGTIPQKQLTPRERERLIKQFRAVVRDRLGYLSALMEQKGLSAKYVAPDDDKPFSFDGPDPPA